jgi:nitroreductase
MTATGFDLALTDRLLTTTKQVRTRLDLTRPVPVELVLECIQVASAAPIGGNREANRWLIVDDPELRAALAAMYRRTGARYIADGAASATAGSRQARVIESGQHLLDHLAEVPVLLLALRHGRVSSTSALEMATFFGSVLPGVWSFQLAARSRGLGSCWTTFHLGREAEAADLLGVPPDVTQVALLPVAFYTGDTFERAPRRRAAEVTYLNRWDQPADVGARA